MRVRSKSEFLRAPIPGVPLPDIEEDDSNTTTPSCSTNLPLSSGNKYISILHTKDSFQVITSDEFAILLKEKTYNNHRFDSVVTLDGRFDYEFKGGRVSGARNICTREAVSDVYDSLEGGNMCIVFHCEFSQNRGPYLMSLFRKYDRQQNIKEYPKLKFPHLFLLKDGYKQFYFDHPEHCVNGYVPMRDKKYILNGQLKKCYTEYTKNMLLSYEEVNNHFFSYKNPILSISPSQFKACSQSTSLDSLSIRGKRSISLPAIRSSCSQTLTFPDVVPSEQAICRSSSKAMTPICVPPHFNFSQQNSLSTSPTPVYVNSASETFVDITDPGELKSLGFEKLSEIYFPDMT